MSDIKPNTKAKSNQENKGLGFAIAIVFLALGCILFFSWNAFGNEIFIKLLSLFFVFFGIAGFGIELSARTKDEGAMEMGIGLAIVFGILIIKSTFNVLPNLIVLLGLGIGALFIVGSIIRTVSSKESLKTPSNIFYRILVIGGQILGAIVSIINFIKLIS